MSTEDGIMVQAYEAMLTREEAAFNQLAADIQRRRQALRDTLARVTAGERDAIDVGLHREFYRLPREIRGDYVRYLVELTAAADQVMDGLPDDVLDGLES